MAWEKVEPWKGPVHQGCLVCPPVLEVAPMDMLIAVGFGYAGVTKDGKEIFNEQEIDENTPMVDFPRLQQFEDMALQDPDHDWRVCLEAPLRGRTYQRHEAGKWVLIESNEGFA